GRVALADLARPDAVGVAAHGVEVAAGEHAVRGALDERLVAGVARLGVAALDQQPAGLAAVARARPHAHEVPAPAQLLAGELERQVALLEPRVRIADRLPGAAVPHEDAAATVLAGRDHAFEVGVLERVVLGLGRQPPLARHQARTLRHRPALEHAV